MLLILSRGYGESIQTRLRAMGISANVMFPPPEVSIFEIVDRISRSGSLYAVVITTQNMYHKSCTLNILHGAPQGKPPNVWKCGIEAQEGDRVFRFK